MTRQYSLSELSAAAYNYVTYAASYMVSNNYDNYEFDCYLSKGMVLWINPTTLERLVTLIETDGTVKVFTETT